MYFTSYCLLSKIVFKLSDLAVIQTAGYMPHCQCFFEYILLWIIVQELSRAIKNVTEMDTDMSVEKIEIDPSNVAKSMTGGANEETIEIPTRVKKTKKKSQRGQVPQLA